MKKTLPAINIQHPISQLILSGKKTIETRTYPLPKKYIGKELLMIETPGKSGAFKARIVATVCFGEPFLYSDERSFYLDYSRHKVDRNSIWAWREEKPKWGWPVTKVKRLSNSKIVKCRRGIVFTKSVSL